MKLKNILLCLILISCKPTVEMKQNENLGVTKLDFYTSYRQFTLLIRIHQAQQIQITFGLIQPLIVGWL
jgi:hypothetical protein